MSELPVPRIARSVDDLVVGQVVAVECLAGLPNAHWAVGTLAVNDDALGFRDHERGWLFPFYKGTTPTVPVFILADPESDPAEQAWEAYSGRPVSGANPIQPLFLAGYRAGQEGDHE